MELLLHQVLAGLATGGIYACLALALVMIYQAIDHLNFAQGEMAMFSTFIAWQLIELGTPYWIAFIATLVISFVAGVLIERVLFRPIHNAPVLSHIVVFIALFGILNSLAGFIWDFNVKNFPTPFGSRPLLGTGLISSLLYGFAAAVVGGLTSPGGAVIGGFAVGIIENLAGTFIPYVGRELKLTIALFLIVAVLLVKPSGLFGRRVVSRV